MQSGQIPNSAITASSEYNANGSPFYARLMSTNAAGKYGGWLAKYNDIGQFLQVDFGKPVKVTKIATQGRYEANQWVNRYTVSSSQDNGVYKDYMNNQFGVVRVSRLLISISQN